ncbi:alpha/beta fold hydrolase [Lysinimonas soli]|uniref:Alpha/beta fold hydrolase n=1 Tax=Lysinimonas soli TaxID=1074233 RepID=A0ABW0NNK6_9MICO
MPPVSVEELDGLERTRGAMVDIAFRVRGDGPAIVLLHGTSANHAVWEPVAEALAGSATVICLDQRGHGRSDKPASGYTGKDFAGDVITVLDALGIDRAIVGGHSLGARNAWLVGAAHPERTRAVLAVDYTPYVETAVIDELASRVAAGDRAFSTVGEIEQYLQERYPRMPADAVARRARWGYRRLDDGSWRPLADPAAMAQLIEGLRTPWAEEFAAVAVPMTDLRGADSRIVSEAAWNAAIAARPQDRWVVDPGSDHYVPEENPGLIITELEHLLATTV